MILLFLGTIFDARMAWLPQVAILSISSSKAKKVILIDDVLWTGRTIRAALDALLAYGRPEKVELLVLIDRRFSRHLPIEPDYIGHQVDSLNSQQVKVTWASEGSEDKVILLSEKL